jgi:uncharacterized protein YjbI with pentapeptide repeats
MGFSFADLDLGKIKAIAPNFDRSKLTHVNFGSSDMEYATLSRSSVDGGSFRGAKMLHANFSGASINAADFSDANLTNAVFDDAILKDVDFSRADIRYVSFRNTKFEGDELTKFSQTAWWLATGWNLQQLDKLAELYPRVGDQVSLRSNQAKDLERAIETAPPGSPQKATAINDMAWELAILGTDLPAAEGFARQALDILPPSDEFGDVRYNFGDTLGYILLQEGKPFEAADVLAKNPNGDGMFKFAVALNALGRTEDSDRYLTLAIEEKHFMPSHEMYLLRRYITGKFREQLQKLIAKQ